MEFRKPKSKIHSRRKVNNADSDDEGASRIGDIRELQRARERKNGLTEIECAVGKAKAAALEDGMEMAGGKMAMSGRQKAKLNAESIEAGIREQFEKETMLRDEDAELKKFIEHGLRKQGVVVDGDDEKEDGADEQNPDVLQRAASKLKGYRSEAGNELLSEHMLGGIPEVDLGINARIQNILETEKKKKSLLDQALGKSLPVTNTDEPSAKRPR